MILTIMQVMFFDLPYAFDVSCIQKYLLIFTQNGTIFKKSLAKCSGVIGQKLMQTLLKEWSYSIYNA